MKHSAQTTAGKSGALSGCRSLRATLQCCAMARPRVYSRLIADKIIQAVSEGMSLREICRRLHVSPGTACGWAAENWDDFGARLRNAQDASYILLEDDVLTRSRQARGGDMAHVQAVKLETDVARWLLAKRHAHYFGERVEHHLSGAAAIKIYVPDNQRLTGDDTRVIDGQALEVEQLEDG